MPPVERTHPGGKPILNLVDARRGLSHINFQYLDLVIGRGDESVRGLSRLSTAAKRAIAECPFSLFTLQFERVAQWTALCEASLDAETDRNLDPQSGQASEACASKERGWITMIMFYAWHLAHTAPLAAQMLLGLGPVASALRRVPVTALAHIGREAGAWLAPRWIDHPYFWKVLTASEGDLSTLRRVHLLGRQLLAAEALDDHAVHGMSPVRPVRPVTLRRRIGTHASTSHPAGRTIRLYLP